MRGIRASGLSLIAILGLMAFAGAAHAANLSNGGVAGEYRVLLGATLVTNTQLNAQLVNGAGTLLVQARNIDILCTAFTVLEGEFKSVTTLLMKLLFEGCGVFEHNNHAVTIPCHIPGGHITVTAKLLPKLHEGKLFVLTVPDTTTKEEEEKKPGVFAKIEYEKGEECPLPLIPAITGSVVGEVQEDATPNRVIFNEAIQKLFQVAGAGDKLLYGANEAFLKGEADAFLRAPHAACKFGVV